MQLKGEWEGDLLGRRADADLLAGYLDSVGNRKVDREDGVAFTIAIDGEYGVGKSFFLRRFAKYIGSEHPVAFVDAWADDLADEPLTALVATLKDALGPLIQDPMAEKAWARFARVAGKVAKLAGFGAAKRALSLLVTAEFADEITAAVGGNDAVKADALAALKETPSEVVDAGAKALSEATPSGLMDERIARFQEGKAAIRELKESLAAIVSALPIDGLRAPIVIIVDELDRCRPTYAVKLLEEIKHLFDVQGLVFLLGTNTEQLSKSICGAYGAAFNGESYLRRFINRQFTLQSPDMTALAGQLIASAGIPESKLDFPGIVETMPVAEIVAAYVDSYGANARDVFGLVDRLQTCCALTGNTPLLMPYLLPLLISDLRTGVRDQIIGG